MKKGNRTIGLFFFLLAQFGYPTTTLAQPGSAGVGDMNNSQQFLADASGKPLFLKTEYTVEGSPYFPNDYSFATLFMKNGKAYTGIKVKLNLNDNTLLYITPDGKEMELTSPINKLAFIDTSYGRDMGDIIFQNGFSPIDKQDQTSFYQVLDSGKVILLKYINAFFQDKREYGSASMTRVFTQTNDWYLRLPDGSMKKLDKGKAAILSLLPSKKEEMSKFIDANGLKCRKESDWIKIITSYNSVSAGTN